MDWAVAKSKGEDYLPGDAFDGIGMHHEATRYSTDWGQAGPLIDQEGIRWNRDADMFYAWIGGHEYIDPLHEPMIEDLPAIEWEAFEYGETLLIAAMRCFVSKKMGEYVAIPESIFA